MVVLLILAILLAIAIPTFLGVNGGANVVAATRSDKIPAFSIGRLYRYRQAGKLMHHAA